MVQYLGLLGRPDRPNRLDRPDRRGDWGDLGDLDATRPYRPNRPDRLDRLDRLNRQATKDKISCIVSRRKRGNGLFEANVRRFISATDRAISARRTASAPFRAFVYLIASRLLTTTYTHLWN